MNIAGNSIGIDYHQGAVQVAVIGSNRDVIGSKRLPNEIEEVIKYVSSLGSVKSVAIEACTGSSSFGEDLRKRTGWQVQLCHPGYVGRMRHNPDKSDKSDAYLLGDLNCVGYLPQVWLAPVEIRELRALVRYRSQIVNNIRNVKLRVQAILRQNRIKRPLEGKSLWSRRGLEWLNGLACFSEHTQWIFERHLAEYVRLVEERKAVEMRMKLVVAKDDMVKFLLKHPGIGMVTALTMRAEIGVFSRFRTGKQLSRFCGLTPRNCSSGERQADSGLIKAGNPLLKTVLIEASHNLMRYDLRWKKFAMRLKKEGKPYSVIVAAVANRWMRKLFYVASQYEQTACGQAA